MAQGPKFHELTTAMKMRAYYGYIKTRPAGDIDDVYWMIKPSSSQVNWDRIAQEWNAEVAKRQPRISSYFQANDISRPPATSSSHET
jgi:hypothetical protein